MARDKDLHRKLLKLNRQYIRAIITAHKNAEVDDERWQTPTEAARGCGLAPGTFNKILNEETPAEHTLSWRTLSQMRDKSGVPFPVELVRAMVPVPMSASVQKMSDREASSRGSNNEGTTQQDVGGNLEMSYAKASLRAMIRHFTLSQVNIWIGEIAEEMRKPEAPDDDNGLPH